METTLNISSTCPFCHQAHEMPIRVSVAKERFGRIRLVVEMPEAEEVVEMVINPDSLQVEEEREEMPDDSAVDGNDEDLTI